MRRGAPQQRKLCDARLSREPKANARVNSTRPHLTPLNLEDARRIVADSVHEYNTLRLHSGIGYVTPQARLQGRDQQILIERGNLVAAPEAREMAHCQSCQSSPEHPAPAPVVAEQNGVILHFRLNHYSQIS